MSKFTSSLWKEYNKYGSEKRTDTLVSFFFFLGGLGGRQAPYFLELLQSMTRLLPERKSTSSLLVDHHFWLTTV